MEQRAERRHLDIVASVAQQWEAEVLLDGPQQGVVAGEAGVDRAIEILRADLDRTLRLLGCPSIAELDQSYVNVPRSW